MSYLHGGKRVLDLITAVTLLVILSPILVLVAVAVQSRLGSPVLFRQPRPGLNGKPFVLFKFRTMTDARDSRGELLPDTDRLTPLGRLLRKTSLDELPELWNVIKGDMSLVGPRPLLTSYLERYTPEQARRHAVRPGITGWAQVNGRQTALFSRRLELDVWYVDHVGFWLDLKILLLTIPSTLFSRGVVLGQSVSEVDDVGLSTRPTSSTPQRSTAERLGGDYT